MKNKRWSIFVVVAFIPICYAEGWGANWMLVGRFEDLGFAQEIDVTSISRHPNNVVRVWLKTHYLEKRKREIAQVAEIFRDVSYSMDLEECDCTNKRTRSLSMAYYSSNGDWIYSTKSSSEWTFIIPDSVPDMIFKPLCKQPNE